MPNSKPPPVRYSGDLGKLWRRPGLINAPAHELDDIAKEWGRRLRLLCTHHDVPPDRLDLLAIALAEAHVPGLRSITGSKRGRKPEWTVARKVQLYEAVQQLIEHSRSRGESMEIRQACRLLATHTKHAKTWGRSKQSKSLDQWVETLESRYQDGRRLQKSTQVVSGVSSGK